MNFTPRLSEPLQGNLYYQRVGYGGYNRCILGNSNGRKYYGCVLPNCTGYAYGRWMECQGVQSSNLSTSNAKLWYGHTSDGYTRSATTPYLGAVICWTGTYGHVAVVEKIYSNTDILWSESNWSGTASNGRYWRTRRGNPATLYSGAGLTFQGYIYPKTTWDGEDPVPGPDPDPTDPDNPDMTESGWMMEVWAVMKKKKGGKFIV